MAGNNDRRYFPGMKRPCPKCGEEIVLTEAMCRRSQYACADCESIRATAWAKRNMARKLAGNKRYFATANGRVARSKHTKRFRERYPEKYAAHVAVQTAVRNGTLVQKPCEVCGCLQSEAHHDDYSKPLEVKWLCDTCHVNEHAMLRARKVHEQKDESK